MCRHVTHVLYTRLERSTSNKDGQRIETSFYTTHIRKCFRIRGLGQAYMHSAI